MLDARNMLASFWLLGVLDSGIFNKTIATMRANGFTPWQIMQMLTAEIDEGTETG
jgi:hypothetical protein